MSELDRAKDFVRKVLADWRQSTSEAEIERVAIKVMQALPHCARQTRHHETDDYEMTTRLRDFLENGDIQTLEGLANLRVSEFLSYRNVGRVTLGEARELLRQVGLDFAAERP